MRCKGTICKILLVFGLLLLNGCGSKTDKELPALEFENDVEYASAFLEAMNTKNTEMIDRLLGKDSIMVYESDPSNFIDLGYTYEKDSHINYLLSLENHYEEVDEESSNLSSIILSFMHSTKLTEDIWGFVNDERSKYEFVIEDQRISLIYVYENDSEEERILQYTQGGIGIEFETASDMSVLRVSYVYAGTPAAVLQLQEGDLIHSINGINISDMSDKILEPQYRLLGAIDSPVVLGLQRNGSDTIVEVTMTRMDLNDYMPLSDEEILEKYS